MLAPVKLFLETEVCSPRRPHKGQLRSDAVGKRKKWRTTWKVLLMKVTSKNKKIGICGAYADVSGTAFCLSHLYK